MSFDTADEEEDQEPYYDTDDDEPDEVEEIPEGFCSFGCGRELCRDCMACHTCDKAIIEAGEYRWYPCYPNHPGIPPELRLPEGL